MGLNPASRDWDSDMQDLTFLFIELNATQSRAGKPLRVLRFKTVLHSSENRYKSGISKFQATKSQEFGQKSLYSSPGYMNQRDL
jgi:hypothetical protein